MLPALRRCRPGPVPLPALAAALGPGPVPGLCPGWSPRAVPARGRKTRHDPPAKSKAARVKLPPPVDPEELLVVLERYRQHRLVLSALRYRHGPGMGLGMGLWPWGWGFLWERGVLGGWSWEGLLWGRGRLDMGWAGTLRSRSR